MHIDDKKIAAKRWLLVIAVPLVLFIVFGSMALHSILWPTGAYAGEADMLLAIIVLFTSWLSIPFAVSLYFIYRLIHPIFLVLASLLFAAIGMLGYFGGVLDDVADFYVGW